MAHLYPAIFTPAEDGIYAVTIPDFPLHTQGNGLADALFMARDAIGLVGICNEDAGRPNPEPTDIRNVPKNDDEILTLVDVDFDAYRAAYLSRAAS